MSQRTDGARVGGTDGRTDEQMDGRMEGRTEEGTDWCIRWWDGRTDWQTDRFDLAVLLLPDEIYFRWLCFASLNTSKASIDDMRLFLSSIFLSSIFWYFFITRPLVSRWSTSITSCTNISISVGCIFQTTRFPLLQDPSTSSEPVPVASIAPAKQTDIAYGNTL